MNEQRLKDIKERADKATGGNWFRAFSNGIEIYSDKEESEIVVEDVGVVRYTDAEFISHARQDIPDLINEIERLQKFKDYFLGLYGEGLEVANWHLNGELEAFDNFYESAVDLMD